MSTGNIYQPNSNSGMSFPLPNMANAYNAPMSNSYMPNTNTWYNQPYSAPNAQNNGSIFGRMVNDESEITPNEVPMDGSISVFPKADGSSIIVKTWNPNGTITTIRYTPVVEGEVLPEGNSPYSEIIERLERIEKKVNYRKPNRKPYKKEAPNATES